LSVKEKNHGFGLEVLSLNIKSCHVEW